MRRIGRACKGRRRLALCALLICAAFLLSGCSNNMLRSARPIEDVHHLDGQRVGVWLGMGADYLLTGRKDMTLVRYNTVADMVLALTYRRVDALALDKPIVPQLMSSISGIGMLEEPIAYDGLVAYVSKEREDLLAQFNEFIPKFQASEAYRELMSRYDSGELFVPRPVETLEGGMPLRVGIMPDNMPFTYLDFTTGELVGCDVEVIQHFANAYGYTLDLEAGTYNNMEMGVAYGTLDMAISGLSDLYREDLNASGRAWVTDVYMPMDIVFVQVTDPDNLKVISAIEY